MPLHLFLLTQLVFTSPALCALPEEQAMKVAIGKAFAKLLFSGDMAAARAECEIGRAGLSVDAPKFLSAYVEACLAVTSSKPGPHPRPESCPYHQRAIEIWTKFPPPKDDEKSQVERAERLTQWKDSLRKECPELAPKSAPEPVDTWSSIKGGKVETPEGLRYKLPPDWFVKNWDKSTGRAFLEGPAGLSMHASREALSAARPSEDYPDREVLSNGRTLEFVHKEFIKGSGMMMLYGQMRLPDAVISFGASKTGSENNAGIGREEALAAVRAVAESLKVTGPRKCLGECGPGKVTAGK